MRSLQTRVTYEALRSIDSATFTGAYQKLGSALLHDPFLIKMVNSSTVAVTVSLDGVTDMDILPVGSFFLYDEQANSSREGGLRLPKGTQIWVKGAAGAGLVYLVVQYQGV
jgi:hypothetical protein